MAECDERRGLAALSLMNSGMEADDASNKTFVAVMCPINRHVGQVFWPSVRTPVKTPYAAPSSVEERPPLISEGHTNFQFRPQN